MIVIRVNLFLLFRTNGNKGDAGIQKIKRFTTLSYKNFITYNFPNLTLVKINMCDSEVLIVEVIIKSTKY